MRADKQHLPGRSARQRLTSNRRSRGRKYVVPCRFRSTGLRFMR